MQDRHGVWSGHTYRCNANLGAKPAPDFSQAFASQENSPKALPITSHQKKKDLQVSAEILLDPGTITTSPGCSMCKIRTITSPPDKCSEPTELYLLLGMGPTLLTWSRSHVCSECHWGQECTPTVGHRAAAALISNLPGLSMTSYKDRG